MQEDPNWTNKAKPNGLLFKPIVRHGPLRAETLNTNPRVSSPLFLLHLLAGACRRPIGPLASDRIADEVRQPWRFPLPLCSISSAFQFLLRSGARRLIFSHFFFRFFVWPTVQYSQPHHWLPEEARSRRWAEAVSCHLWGFWCFFIVICGLIGWLLCWNEILLFVYSKL